MVGAHAQSRRQPRRWTGLVAILALATVVADGAFLALRTPPGRTAADVGIGQPAGPGASTTTTSSTTAPPSSTTSAPTPAVDLAPGLLVPEAFDGNYHEDPSMAEPIISSSACLGAIAGYGSPDATASTYLDVENLGDLPAVLELVLHYPTGGAAFAAWTHDTALLEGCRPLRADVEGAGTAVVDLSPVSLASLNLEATGRSAAYVGHFDLAGLAQTLDLAVVDGHGEVLVVLELDRDPPVAGSAIYDNFGSAVVTAYGMLAGT